jgi:hypothetical protein
MSKIIRVSERLLEELDRSVPRSEILGRLIIANIGSFETSGAKEKSDYRHAYSLLQHSQTPQIINELVKKKLEAKQEVAIYVANLCADGSFYWMFTKLQPTHKKEITAQEYNIIEKKPSENAMRIIPNLFRMLLICEHNGGVASSKKMLDNLLEEHQMDYNEFVQFLQR